MLFSSDSFHLLSFSVPSKLNMAAEPFSGASPVEPKAPLKLKAFLDRIGNMTASALLQSRPPLSFHYSFS